MTATITHAGIELADASKLSRDDWLALRRTGIGGSDVAAILGVSPWANALDVWMTKSGRAADWSGNNATRWGQRLEAAVREGFAEDIGTDVVPYPMVLQHADHDWILANIDGAMPSDPEGFEDGLGIFEAKATAERNGEHWDGDEDHGEVPDWYQLQVQHYFNVTGWQWGYIACLIGGNRLVWRRVERNQTLIDLVMDDLAEFWQHVLDDTPPPINGPGPVAKRALCELYGDAEDRAVELPADTRALVRTLDEVKATQKKLKARRDDIENTLRSRLGHATVGTVNGIEVVSWKPQGATGTTDWAAIAADLKQDDPDVVKDLYYRPGTTRVLRTKKAA